MIENQAFEEAFVDRVDSWQLLFEALRNRNRWKYISSFVRTGSKCVEIGVGTGSFLYFLKEQGMSVDGCDASQPICDYVQEKYGIRVVCGSIREVNPSLAYDVVFMNHVLEHLPNPLEMLSDIRARMAPAAWLHIAVPNRGAWEAVLPGWTSYQPYHLLYFDESSLRQTLSRAGFKIVSSRTVEPFSGWFLAIVRTLLGMKNNSVVNAKPQRTQANRAARLIYRTLMVIIGLVTTPLRWMQAKLGYGEELVVIACSTNP
jgi:SAM-dependent methyltransferase